MPKPLREGEMVAEGLPPATGPALRFIGHIHSPWGPDNCPKNLIRARESGQGGEVVLDPAFAPALRGLAEGQAVILLYWMHEARRDLLVQAPGHTDGPRGTFALRSPNRPNTIAQATVCITRLAPGQARFGIDAIDCFDGTPLLDLKPWLPSIDTPPPA